MSKKINLGVNLQAEEAKKELKKIQEGKYEVDLDVNVNGAKQATQNMNQMGSSVKNTTTIFGKLKNAIQDTFSSGKLAMTSYLAVLKSIDTAASQAKKTIDEYDKSITDLSVAMNGTREEAAQYIQTLNKQAIELKTTTKSASDAADSWLRQGKSVADTETLIHDSLVLSKVGQIESADATDYLTSALNGYKLEAQDAISVIDKLTAVDAISASESGGLAESMSKTASAADMAGVSMDKLVGWIATVKETTRAANPEVGNAIKTMLSRMNQVRAGKFIDEETGESLNDFEKVLGKIGISLRDANGQFISSEKVLDELGQKFNTLDSVTQRAVATTLGGSYQYTKIISLLSNYDKALKYTETAENSAGSAMKKFETSYLDSLEAKQNALQATFESAVMDSDMNEVYGNILDATTALVKFVDETNALKGALTGLATFAGIKAFMSIKAGATEAYVELNKFTNAVKIAGSTNISTAEFDKLLLLSDGLSKKQMKLVLSTNSLTVAQKKQLLIASGLSEKESIATLQAWKMSAANNGLTASTTSASNAFKGLWLTLKANPLILVMSAVTIGVSAWQKYKQSIEEVNQATSDAASTYKSQSSSIEEYISKYQDLRKQLIEAKGNEEATQSVKEQLLDLQKQLNNEFGTEYGKLNLVTDAYKDQTEAIKAYNKEAANDYLNKNRKGIKIATDKMTEDNKYSLGTMNGLVNADELDILEKIKEIASDKGINFTSSGFEFVGNAEEANSAINAFMNSLKELREQSGETSDTMSGIFDGLLDNSGEALEKADDIISKYQEQYQQAQLAEIASNDSLSSSYNKAIDAVQKYNDAVANSENPYNDDNVKSAYDELEKIKATISDDSDWDNYRKIIDDTFSEADTGAYEFKQSLDKNEDGIKNCAEALKGLSETDLQAMLDSGDNESFNKLTASADAFGLSIEDVISLLKEMGIVVANSTEDVDASMSFDFDTDSFFEKIDAIQSGYDKLLSAQEEFNTYGAITSATLKELMDNDLLQYMTVTADGISINTSALEQNEQALKDSATAELYNAMCNDIQNLSLDDTSQLSSIAQTAIANLDFAATTAGENAAIAAQGWWEYGNSIKNIPGVANLTGDKAEKAQAIVNQYKNLANQINRISVGKTNSSKKKSSSASKSSTSSDPNKEQFETEYDLLKHNLEMEYITEEDYYNGVQALNEKYFAGKEEYLDEYRKYEEEVYKGLKSYYKSYCDDMMDYYDKKLDASKMSYKEYCDSVSKMLADMHNSGKISDKDWYDYTKTMLEKQKDVYDRALSAITRRLQKEIDKIQDQIDAIEKQNDALNEQKDNYDKILSVVSNVYDKEIDRLNKQKDAIQDQIDALNDKNDALDLQKRKEEALYALEKAQQNRTRKLYVEGRGYFYDTDSEAIRDAQKDLSDIKNEELINSLQKEQDKLQESIDILNQYKEKWNEIPDAWDKAVGEQLAIELWGQEYEKLILMNRTSDIENFKTKYLKIQSQINDNEQLIKSYEEKVEYYTKLKEQWQSLTDEYSNSVDDMYAKQLLGAQWESDVLNGRLSTLNDFRNQYNDIQKSISDMAWQSANAQISALNAVKAAEATKAQTSGGSNGYSGSSGNVSSVGGNTSGGSGLTAAQKYQVRLAGTVKVIYEGSSETDLRNWITRNNYIGVSRTIQNNIIIYFAKKKEKKYIGQVYKTSGQASSQVGMLGGVGYDKVSGGYQVYKYAKGTDNAKKGWHIVSEENPELIARNNGEINLAKGEQFYKFEGGETVIPADETKKILKNQGNVETLSDSDVITRKDGSILKPIHYEYENILTNFIKDNPDYMYSMNTMLDNMCRDLFKNTENVNYDNRSVDNRVSIGEIHLHEIQNVDQFARELDRQLAGIVDQKLSRRKR